MPGAAAEAPDAVAGGSRRTSIALVSAWPMCREPVTLGGGMTITNGGLSARRRRGDGQAAPSDAPMLWHGAWHD